MKHKILIIKLGHSETLHPEIDIVGYGLGDVLRTTVILHLFKNSQVTWLADQDSIPLLENIQLIHKILPYNLASILQLQAEHFDMVINLEKVPGICALADSIDAELRHGFRFEKQSGKAIPHSHNHKIFEPYMSIEKKRKKTQPWQEVLFQLFGKKWNQEGYILGYQPESKILYDVGLNHKVGSTWAIKAWPFLNFIQLEYRLGRDGYSVELQHGENDLKKYIDWIDSCRVIVTNDSLGLHLSLALKKKVIALFGPTSSHEAYMYELGTKILPETNYDCVPCLGLKCTQTKNCMEEITVDRVYNEVVRYLADEKKS